MNFKFLVTAAAVSMALSSVAQAAVEDGTYEGSANGKNGPVTVAVTMKAGKIADVKVVKSGESAMISDVAIARVPAEIVKNQSLRVNNVSGATLTSMAIQAAATNAVITTKHRQRKSRATLTSSTRPRLSWSAPARAAWLPLSAPS